MYGSNSNVSENEVKTAPCSQDEECIVFLVKSQRVKIQHLRLISLLIFLIYLVLYFSYVSKLEANSLIIDLFFLSLIVACPILVYTYFSMGKVQLKIEMYGDRVLYPNFYFWKKCLLCSDVFSSENLFFRNKLRGIIVAKIDGGVVFFDKNRFEYFEDFERFARIILNVAASNKRSLDQTKKIYVHRKSNSIYLVQVMFLIVWFGVLGYFYFDNSIGYFSALELGALTKSVRVGEEWYRIFSSFFLHISAVHVLSNTAVFGLMADSLLRLVDTFRFLTTIFLAAFIGSIASLYLSPHEYVIGASGGIFGLFGAYCVVKFTKNLPGTVSQQSNKMVFAVIVIQVVTEYFVDGIDSYSHVGGFFAGALCMSVYLHFAQEQSIYESTKVEKGIAVILTGAYLWGLLTFLFKVYA